MWALVGIETFHCCLHLVVELERKKGGGMWYSQHHYGWFASLLLDLGYMGAGGH